ncbi:MAG: hypothetical protein RBS25_06370 [Bacilli bacterium]|jgi:hypothetical protein|nr:hypothetical protein [Bacilli bacterium]
MTYEITSIPIELKVIENSLLIPRLKDYQKQVQAKYYMETILVDTIVMEDNSTKVNAYKRIVEQANYKKAYTLNKNSDVLVCVEMSSDNKKNIVWIAKKFTKQIQMMEYVSTGLVFFEIAMKEGLFPLHASAIAYQNQAILFSAPAGVGKSTQAILWEQEEAIRFINDDKPLIEFSNPVQIHGSPWCGKTMLQSNTSYPLACILFIVQDKKDFVEEMTANEKIIHLIKNTHRSDNPVLQQALLNQVDQLITTARIARLHCTPTKNAVQVVKEYLNGLQ